MILHTQQWPLGHQAPQRGFVQLPGTGRLVYWTGRVAIGLNHQPSSNTSAPVPHSQLWVQELVLDNRVRPAP